MNKTINFLFITLCIAGLTMTQADEAMKNSKGYISIGAAATLIDSRTTGIASASAALYLSPRWALGITGSGYFHDEELDVLVDDGTYHMYIHYGGLFIERIMPVTSNLQISLALMTGTGTAFYQYDHEYRQEKVWSEEIIDMSTFGVQEFYVNLHYQFSKKWMIGLNASFRNTGPLRLIQTDNDLLKNASAGLDFRYQL